MGIFHYINPVNWFRAEQRFDASAEFEGAVNHVLTADTVADAARKPYISEEGALNLSAVWACVRILSDTVGTLPIHLYKRTDKGRERQYTHPCHRLLQLPNPFSNRFDLMHHLMTSCALWQRLCPNLSGQQTSPSAIAIVAPRPCRAYAYHQR